MSIWQGADKDLILICTPFTRTKVEHLLCEPSAYNLCLFFSWGFFLPFLYYLCNPFIMEINPLMMILFVNIFSQFINFLCWFSSMRKLSISIQYKLLIFFFDNFWISVRVWKVFSTLRLWVLSWILLIIFCNLFGRC